MKKSLMTALCAAALLSACGGGGGDTASADLAPPSSASDAPPSASASATGFMSFIQQMKASPADTLEPVNVSSVTPPAADTAEPWVFD